MYLADVRGSIAYSKALLKVGILTQHEANEIERGLGEVAKEWETKTVSLSASLHRCGFEGALYQFLYILGERERMDELTFLLRPSPSSSSLPNPTTRISTPPTSDVSQRSSARTSEESFTPADPGTIRSPRI